jgi:hypothetical protein
MEDGIIALAELNNSRCGCRAFAGHRVTPRLPIVVSSLRWVIDLQLPMTLEDE